MSKEYASKDALLQLSRAPRIYTDVDIPRWGTISVQTINAGEFCRIDAARNRAVLMASQGELAKQAAALKDYFVEIAKAGVAEPAFSDADRELLLSLDSETADAIKQAVLAHCGIKEADGEDHEKNSSATSGGSLPSASGTT